MTAYASLIPQGNPRLDPIHVESTLFVVGNTEAPFCDYGPKDLEGLDGDHARLFNENGAFHLVHMGRSGTTRVNNSALGKAPIKLSDGDQISFARNLRFRIRLNQDIPQASSLSATLEPGPDNPRTEKIVLSSFPVLICRNAEVLKHYRAEGGNSLKLLSRRHAYLFSQGRSLYVEDLGSTNGTFVNGTRLPAHVRTELSQDDVVSFGHLHLAFAVRIEELEAATMISPALTGKRSKSPSSSGTLFIRREDHSLYATGADSFLSIFCDRPDELSLEESEPVNSGKKSVWSKAGLFLGELKVALSEPESANSSVRRKLVYWSAALLVLSGAAFLFFHTAPTREMMALMERQDYKAGMRQGLSWLAEDPENDKLRSMVHLAMIKGLVPQWLSNIKDRKFVEATRLMMEARQMSRGDRDARTLIATLNWITDLEEFYAWRGGADAPLVLFKHEKTMDLLLRRRATDEGEQDLTMAQIAARVPEFDIFRTQITSHLRALRNEENIYLKAIDRLKKDVERQLGLANWAELLQQLDEFEAQYPRISGVGVLRDDVQHFATLLTAYERSQLALVLENYDRPVSTPIVGDAVRAWTQKHLPDDAAMKQHSAALQAWQDGHGELAIEHLAALEDQTWGEVAAAKRAHFTAVLEKFTRLTGDPAQSNQGLRLLEFHRSLDPFEDTYYLDAIAGEVNQQRDLALAEAHELALAADKEWQIYKRAGGIDGLLRLEDAVSAPYRSRSERLAIAFDKVSGSVRLYDLLREQHPPATAQLYDDVMLETKRQRQWLSDLAMVLNTDLLNAKLDLLPNPEGAQQ